MTEMASQPGLLARLTPRRYQALVAAGAVLALPTVAAWAVWFYSANQEATHEARRALARSILPSWLFSSTVVTIVMPGLAILLLLGAYFVSERSSRAVRFAHAAALALATAVFTLNFIQ